MSSPDSSNNQRVLYLQQIDIETAIATRFRVKLQLDNNDVELQREGRTWSPASNLEFPEASKIRVVIKIGPRLLPFRKQEVDASVSGQEAMDEFWESNNAISRKVEFDQQAATVIFKFRPSRTGNTTRAALNELQTVMETYRTIMTSSVEQRLDTAIKYGATVAEMNPISKAVFAVATVTLDLLKEQRKYDEIVSDLAVGIARILPFADRVLEDVLYDETETLDGVVRKMRELIVDTATFICAYAKRSPGARAAKTAISLEDHRKIKDLQDDFTRLKEDFDRAVDVAALKTARELVKSHLLERLNPVGSASYQGDRGCMQGTRTMVLEDILSWAVRPRERDTPSHKSNTDNIFWLYGMPGLGKTSVANSLCHLLHNKRNLGGSFFCRRDDPILREPKRILPTLIYRLAGMWSPYATLVAQALRDDPQLSWDSPRDELLLKPLRALQNHPTHTLVLVIDALDECGDPNTRQTLLGYLVGVCSSVHWLKIIITSRPEHDITSFFDQHDVTYRRDLAADVEASKDIRLFARSCMSSVARNCSLPSDWPGDKRLNQIVERSGGLFIFVETVYRLLDDPDPEPVLTQVLDGESEGANTELHKLYSTVIRSRIGRRTEAFRSIIEAIVVVSTYRPLRDETLASLIGLKPHIVRSWVNKLGSLLYRDGSTKGGVRVRHLSVLEFLTGPTCPTEFRVDSKRANAELARRCLVRMRKEMKFNICELTTSCLPNAEIKDLDDRVQRKISDGLQYSCMYWPSHLCFDSDPVDMEISGELDKFFTGAQPLYWLEVLSLMREVRASILALQQLKACIKKFQDRHQHQFRDLLYFVLAFYTPISTSTPHLYISALPFTPTESHVWKHASTSFPKLINVCKGRMGSWPALAAAWHGHTGAVISVGFSPDGRYVVSGSGDKTIRIWDAATGAAVGEPLEGHSSWVSSVAFSPDGRYVVSGSGDKTIRIWDASTGAAVGEPLEGHTNTVKSVAFSPDSRYVVSGSDDYTIQIWDAATGAAVVEPLKGHRYEVNSVAFSPDGRYVVSGSSDHTVRIWDAATGAAVGEPLEGHIDEVSSVAFSPDGRYVVSGSDDYTIQIWDAATGAAVGEPLEGHIGAVSSVAFSPDGRYVVSGSHHSKIQIWDTATGAAVGGPLKGHTEAVHSVAFSPDGRYVVSGSHDNTVRIWDTATEAAPGEPLEGHIGEVSSVAFSPDGRYVVSGSHHHKIRIWDAATGAAVGKPLEGHTNSVNSVAFSPDGQYVVSGSWDYTVRIWDAATGAAVGEPLKGHTYNVKSVAFSPDGRYVVSGSWDNTVRIWDAETGAAVGEPLEGHSGWVHSVAFSPDGQYVASGSSDGTIRIWDAATGAAAGEPLEVGLPSTKLNSNRLWPPSRSKGLNRLFTSQKGKLRSRAYHKRKIDRSQGPRSTRRVGWRRLRPSRRQPYLERNTNIVTSVAFSPDGRYGVSGLWNNTVRIWDAATGAAVGEPLKGHTNNVHSVAFSPDDRYVVSGSSDATIRIWDAATGEAVGEPLEGHTDAVRSVAFSPDGRYVASGSSDATIRIWDAETGVAVGEPLEGHSSRVSSVAFSPDGRYVASGSWDEGNLITTNPPTFTDSDTHTTPGADSHILADSNGWVHGAEGLLFWVPEDCRHGLTCPAILTIPNSGHRRAVQLDFTHFQYGASWPTICGVRGGKEDDSGGPAQ